MHGIGRGREGVKEKVGFFRALSTLWGEELREAGETVGIRTARGRLLRRRSRENLCPSSLGPGSVLGLCRSLGLGDSVLEGAAWYSVTVDLQEPVLFRSQ